MLEYVPPMPRKKSRSLRARIVRVATVTADMREEMWRLFARYYDDVSREMFLSDLGRKRHVILMRDANDRSIQGFSTLAVYDQTVGGRRVVAVFSGDTIVDRAYWGQTALHRAFVRYVLWQWVRHALLGGRSVYWFLITKGYRTYLLLSRTFPEHWPRHECPTPQWELDLLGLVARDLFGDAYRPELGVLQFESASGCLKKGVASIDEAMLREPDIAFFARKNAGYARGDELCCLGKVDVPFFAFFARKQLKRFYSGSRRSSGVAASGVPSSTADHAEIARPFTN